jgi:uncharacterized protein (DUF433 family)
MLSSWSSTRPASSSAIPTSPGGEPIFRGTRVPVATLFEHLEEGYSLQEFLDGFPTVDRRDLLALLREAHSFVVGQDLRRPTATAAE